MNHWMDLPMPSEELTQVEELAKVVGSPLMTLMVTYMR